MITSFKRSIILLWVTGEEKGLLGSRYFAEYPEWAAEIAKRHGIEPQDDPRPQRSIFIRSDQYSFIRKGVPAVQLDVGYKLDTPQQKLIDEWLHQRYHAPSDDLQQPVNFETVGRFEGLVWDLLAFTADNEKIPEWKPDSFFKRFARD